jgi:hypothetical protein
MTHPRTRCAQYPYLSIFAKSLNISEGTLRGNVNLLMKMLRNG